MIKNMNPVRSFALNFIISIVLLLCLVQFLIPGDLTDIIKSDGYSVTLTGKEALASAFNVFDTQINGQDIVTTGGDSQFCLDVSKYRPFKFVRIQISGLTESQKAQVFWIHPNEAMNEQASSGIFSLKNGMNVVRVPNDGLMALRFDFATDSHIALKLDSMEFTNNFYISQKTLIIIFAVSLLWALFRIGFISSFNRFFKKTKFARSLIIIYSNAGDKFSQNKEISLFVLFCFANYSLWTIITPFNGSPDESMRWDIVNFLAKYSVLPQGNNSEIINPIWGFSYAFLPFTPQIISAFFVKLISLFTSSKLAILYAARFPSILFSLGTVWFTWLIGNKLFEKRAAWFLTIFIALFPENMMIASYINNDSFALFTTSIIIYAWIIGIDSKFDNKSTITLAIGIGLCLISYYNAFGFILLSIPIWLHVVFKNNKPNCKGWFEIIKKIGLIFGIVFIIAGWWYIRQVIIYDGDFLGLNSQKACGELLAPDGMKPSSRQTFLNQGNSIFALLTQTSWLHSTVHSFVAQFGHMNISAPLGVYIFYGLLFIIGAIGLTSILYNLIKKTNPKECFPKISVFWICMILSIPIPIILSLYNSYSSDFQPQGRYILPMLVSLAVLCTLGISALKRLISNRISLLLLESGIFISNAVCFISVFSAFYSNTINY